MKAKTGAANDIELVVLLNRIVQSQLDIIELRLRELQESSPKVREVEVLKELRALSRAAQGVLGNMQKKEVQNPASMAS